jgi:soluble lytic murein transglycosylase-like protein
MIPPMAALFVGMLLAFLSQNLAPTAAPAGTGGELSPVFTAEVQFWSSSIVRWATEAGVDPNLAATVMQIESCGDPRARSSAGAMGLFQVMPWHFRPLEDTYDPDTNALRGLAYLKAAMEKSGNNVRLALAGYNGGLGVIGRPEHTWAAETQRYVYWGSGIYSDAGGGNHESPRLQEWLSRGGGMCARARQHLGISP